MSAKAITSKVSGKPGAKKSSSESTLTLNSNELLKRVQELMSISGLSGNEGDVAAYIKKSLVDAGADESWFAVDQANKKTPIPSNTGNLFCYFPGTEKGPRRLLMAHMDTVPVCVGSKPVRKGEFLVSGNKDSGLGADDRAGVAVVLTAAIEILRKKLPHPPITFCWTIQEEIGLHGARTIDVKKLKQPKLAFNWDGGAPQKMTIGATGGYRMTIRIRGLASHAGVAPEKGVSAIAIAGIAIADLHKRGWHGKVAKKEGTGTTNIGVISGGAATNVVTDLVEIKAEARSHDPKFRNTIITEIENAFKDAATKVKNVDGATGSVEIEGRLDYESFKMDENDPSVLAAAAAAEVLGLKPELSISNGGLDANWMAKHGVPVVTMGCGQVNAHQKTEMLDIQQFLYACEMGVRLATATEST